MIQLHIQTQAKTQALVASRTGEKKLGEQFCFCDSLDEIASCTASYVVFGIAESIGVRANYGNSGTQKAWKSFVKSIVNVQENEHNSGKNILLLGHISITPNEAINNSTPKEKLGDIVSRIDKKVAQVVNCIIKAGKTPIIIGGGHNNAYGNLKGASQSIGKPINALNIDAHTDLRKTDYRHSGNGFSYAINAPEGPFLHKYAIFGLHKNYTPTYIFKYMNSHQDTIHYKLFEDILQEDSDLTSFRLALNFVADGTFGLELDCDAITDFPSSAQTPSGFTLNQVRTYVQQAAAHKNCTYFHICEASPKKKTAGQVGKALSYLVTDFIRSNNAN